MPALKAPAPRALVTHGFLYHGRGGAALMVAPLFAAGLVCPVPLLLPLPPRLIIVKYGGGQAPKPCASDEQGEGTKTATIPEPPRTPQDTSTPSKVQFTALGSLANGRQPMKFMVHGILCVQPPLARAAGLMQADPLLRGGQPGWPGQSPDGSVQSRG